MATKTEEVINVIQREITRLQTLMEGLQDEVTRANLIELRPNLAVLDAAVAELKKARRKQSGAASDSRSSNPSSPNSRSARRRTTGGAGSSGSRSGFAF